MAAFQVLSRVSGVCPSLSNCSRSIVLHRLLHVSRCADSGEFYNNGSVQSSTPRVKARTELGLGDYTEEEDPEERGEVNGRVALNSLDDQLRTLSSLDVAPPRKQTTPSPGPQESGDVLAWPVFSEGFLVYVGVSLLVLTVVNNILFRIFLGPPVKPEKKAPAIPEVRYRLRSQNEITSLAPPLVNKP